jgi:hypothetical protein
MSRLAAWWRRRQRGGAALLLYTLVAVAMMAPLAPRDLPFSGACDVCNHVSGIIEARNALREGQFPIRVTPNQNHNERYALFQFYGNFPYTLGGFLYRVTHADPYTIWKAIVTAGLALGGFFTYLSGRCLTRHTLPSLAAGLVFITAPYLLTDIHGRVAYCEIVSFTLLPIVFYFAWRCFAGRGLGVVLASGASWCALALSHNITYFYGSLFLGLFFLSYASLRRRLIGRWVRVGGAFGLGVLLAAWYIVPQLLMVPHLCAGLANDVQSRAWLTPLGVLLAPSVALPTHLGSPFIAMPEHFGLQVGWPILIAVGLALFTLRHPLTRGAGRRAIMVRLLVMWGLAFFLVWSPVDVWSRLPSVFSFVQFSYRLLMFVVLFGSLLTAYALTLTLEGRMKPLHLAVLVLAAGWSAAPYLTPHRMDPSLSIEQEIATPEMGRGGAGGCYRVGASCLARDTLVHPDVNWVDERTGGLLDLSQAAYGKLWAVLPAPVPGDALRLEGWINKEVKGRARLLITVNEVELATPELPAGPYQLTLPLPPAPGQERVRVVVHGDLVKTIAVTRLALQPGSARPPAPKLVPASEVRALMKWGHPSVLQLQTAEVALVQLPVTYYPCGLSVELDGHKVPPLHLGRYVALELPPGAHNIAVRYIGSVGANAVSAASWGAMAVALLVLAGLRLCGRPRQRAGIMR